MNRLKILKPIIGIKFLDLSQITGWTFRHRRRLALLSMLLLFGWLISHLHHAAAVIAQGDGAILIAAASNTTPQLRSYTGSTNTFAATTGTIAGTQPNIVQLKWSPFKDEAVAGYEDTSGNLQVMCYNGSSWSNEWSLSVGGTGTTRRFDIAYESTSGDVTVAYSRNTAATNALAYRTKAGSSGCGTANWASAANFPTTTSVTTGTVQWVKAARNGLASSNVDAFIWADSNSDLGGALWNGSAFTNFKSIATTLEVITSAQDVDDFELQYESTSGDLMVVYADSTGSNGTQGAWFNTCTGGTSACTWGTSAKISAATGDDATVLDLSADPTSDKMAFASIGNAGADLQAAYWSGSAWSFYANLDTSCETPGAGMRLTQTGWVTNGANTRWILTYDDSTGTALGWYSATPGSTPVKQTDFTTSPTINDIRERYQIDNNPFDNSELMLTLTDSTKKIIAEQLTINGSGTLTWTNASASAGLGTVNNVPPEGFSFQYRRFIPPPVYNQAAYRLFSNVDSANVGSPLAAANTAATISSTAFRLRAVINVSANDLDTSPAFKLQYAQMSGSCDTAFSGETYADVTGSSTIAFNDNPSVSDESSLTGNANDPAGSGTTHAETYQEANDFSAVTNVAAGDSGEWDFSLKNNGGTAGASYCLRIVKSGGGLLDSYTQIPKIDILTLTQSSYRWFDNVDQADPPGAALAPQNTPFTLTSSGQQFRLRQLIKPSLSLTTGSQNFSEQYADLSSYGACSAIPSNNWSDVGGSGSGSIGPSFPSSASNDASIGTQAWTNPANATADDSSNAVLGLSPSVVSNYLSVSNFGFSIPVGATIAGIVVEVKKIDTINGTSQDNAVRLVKGGTIQTTDESNASPWPLALTYVSYGSPSDLWGTTWTPSDINSSNFGFAISVKNGSPGILTGAGIDAVRVTVYYVSSTGPSFAGAAADDSSNGGQTAWTNPGNVTADDSSFAAVSLIGGNTSHYLDTSGFNFSIPAGAAISGISADVKRSVSGIGFMQDSAIRLIKGGVVGTTDRSVATGWPSTPTYQSYGSSSDLWGDTWTPADINSSNFGLAIAVTDGSSNTADIDAIRITVYYTLPSSGGITYYDNATPASGDTITYHAGTDPTDSGTYTAQTYQESDNFGVANTISANTDGEWDLSLLDNGAPAGTTYCFRTVKADGTPLDTYTQYPMITTRPQGPTTDQLMRGGTYFSSGTKQSLYWAR